MYNNNYGFNPYYQPQRFQPINQPMEQSIVTSSVPTRSLLNGKSVDSLDVVKAMDIPLDGSVSYFPLTDGSAIVTKQLQSDGTSKTIVYKPTIEEKEEKIQYLTRDDLKDIEEELKELRKEFTTLKTKEE